jgi:hypothetical protein
MDVHYERKEVSNVLQWVKIIGREKIAQKYAPSRKGWWKLDIWGLKEMRGNSDRGICPICKKEEGWSHILRCEGTLNQKNELLEK